MNTGGKEATGIAVIGMAGRFPKARNIAEFWQNLRNGVEAISFFTDEELREAGVQVPEDQTNYVKARAVLEDADKFDAEFFGINPKEAEIMDPQHRLFLETAWEALEDAGYASRTEERAIGVYGGMSMNTYLLTNLCSRPDVMDLVGGYQIMLANDKDYLPTRVSYKLNLRGPSVNVQTACSTSLVAVSVACEQILNYQCDIALAGGVSISFPQKRGYLYQEGGISSRDGHCRAFDAEAQGTVPGDGVGIVVLKRLAEAIQDRDHIYAVIKGFATNNDGSLKAGFTAPSPDGQAEAIALAQAVSGIAPESIGYVVAHGTGTPLGDPIEVEGLTKAFRAGTDATQFCAITSVKTNIGHLDAAAGIAGLLNAILAVHHKEIPPNLHFHSPNPKIDFASSPFYVNKHLRDWTPPNGKPRRAGVSSFGIGGTNAHVIVEQAPAVGASSEPPRSASLLVLSARTEAALEKSTGRLASHLERENLNLADVAHTLAMGRASFEHRRAVVCRELSDAIPALHTLDPNSVVTSRSAGRVPVAFMFPGQGAQHVNMGLELYRIERVFREIIDGCAELLKADLGVNLRDLLYPKSGRTEEASQQLMQTAVTQPALFSIEYALAKLWMSWGVEPESLIGHSIGEYVAACLAGVFQLKDALHLVALRGSLIQRLPKGAMLAVRLSEQDARGWQTPEISLASINSPTSCVMSGPSDAIDALAEKLRAAGVAAQRLHTSHAFHSPMLDPIRTAFAQAVQRVHLRSPRIPYLSNLTGTWITPEQATSPAYWADHMRQSVRFADGLSQLFSRGPLCLVEVGPGRTVSTFARQHPGKQDVHTIVASLPHAKADQSDDYRSILFAAGQLWTAGVELDWQTFYGDKRRRVSLPTYPFEQKRYWIEPGRRAGGEAAASTQASACVVAPIMPAAPTASPPDPRQTTLLGRDLVCASLKSLFSQLSGLKVASIDSRTSFTELGFDSLFLTQASQAIEKQFGVKVPFGQLLEQFSTIDLLTSHLCQTGGQGLSNASRAPLTEPSDEIESGSPMKSNSTTEMNYAPLTDGQKEIWFAAQYGDDASSAFNESNLLYLRGALDMGAFQKSLQAVVDRHESLRTTFSLDGETQDVQKELTVSVPLVDLSGVTEAEQQQRLNAMLEEEARKPFDLSAGPLLRGHLVRLQPNYHVLLLTIHHIICDGASWGILLNEMSEIYSAERRGIPYQLPPAPRFVDFAQKQCALQKSPERKESEEFWMRQFKTLPPHLELPLDLPRPPHPTFTGGWQDRALNGNLCRELSRVSARQKSTLFITFLAAYYVFLHRLTGQDEIVIGVPTAERSDAGSEKLVGHCINFLPLRSELRGNPRFVDFLADLRTRFLTAFQHQNYTFGALLQKLQMSRDRARTPLVSAMFNMVWVRTGLNFGGLEVEIKPNPMSFSNFELTFNITETDGAFTLDSCFKSDLLEGATVKRWMHYFETLLEGIAANPEERISKLPLLPQSERAQILATWNETQANYPRNAALPDFVAAQAKRTPNAVAATAGKATLTYQQLTERAGRWAPRLRGAGVTEGSRVAMLIPASLDMLVAVLAVLQAGGVLIALDGLISDLWNVSLLGQAAFFLGTRSTVEEIKDFPGKCISIEELDTGENASGGRVSAEALAVVVPSGTAQKMRLRGYSHRAIGNVVHWLAKNSAATAGAVTAHATPPGTERFLHEIFATWCSGGNLALSPSDRGDVAALLSSVEKPQRAFLSRTQLAALAASENLPDTLREIVIHGGEPAALEDLRKLKERLPQCAILLLYESSEAGVATAYSVNGAFGKLARTPIGRPIQNIQAFVLDSELNPVPPGVPGRLFVGGDSLSSDSEDSSGNGAVLARQIDSALSGRLVETGDIARFLPDGTIELVHPNHSFKEIDGWEIDFASLQASIVEQAGISDAALTTRNDLPGTTHLVAYLASAGRHPAEADIVKLLRAQLPPCNVRITVVWVDSIPRTASGKIDVAALPSPSAPSTGGSEQVLPRNRTEEVLAQIWCDVIGLESAGIHDNFFELGGHSVLVTQIVTRIRKAFQVEIGLRTVFERATIAELGKAIEELLLEEIGSMTEEEASRLAKGTELLAKVS